MTVYKIFKDLKKTFTALTLDELVTLINDSYTENDLLLARESVSVTATSSQNIFNLKPLVSGEDSYKVQSVDAVWLTDGDDTYRIPLIMKLYWRKASVDSSGRLAYRLYDNKIEFLQWSGATWGNITEDKAVTLDIRYLPELPEVANIDKNTPIAVNDRISSIVKDYVIWHLSMKQLSDPSVNFSQEYFQRFIYLSKYHQKEYYRKIDRFDGGNVTRKPRMIQVGRTSLR